MNGKGQQLAIIRKNYTIIYKWYKLLISGYQEMKQVQAAFSPAAGA